MSKVEKTEFVSFCGGDKDVPVSELSPQLQEKIKQADDFFTKMNALEEAGDTEGIHNLCETHPHNQ
jgi:hypothetical protein